MAAQFVNEYQKNEHTLNELFNSLTNFDKGRFIENNIKYFEYTDKIPSYVCEKIKDDMVIEYVKDHQYLIKNILEIVEK